MRRSVRLIAGTFLFLMTWTVVEDWTVSAQSGAKFVRTRLSGFQEVPVVSTDGTGEFRARIDRFDSELTYELEYGGLRGAVTQAHIHFGAGGTNGGVMVWLCGTATNPGPAGTPACPQEGSVGRTVTASDVIGPAGQGVSAGDFEAVVRAVRAGVAYVNVHSSLFPGGEIRGQLREEH
jgi:hypothetical protein